MMTAVLTALVVCLFVLWVVAEHGRRYYRREAERYRRVYRDKVKYVRQVFEDPEV